MVNTLKNHVLPLVEGKYDNSTKWSTQRHHQGNKGKSSLEAERDWALGALHSLRSKRQHAPEKQRETHSLSNEEKEEWMEDCVERETAGATNQVEDAEAAIMQEQKDTESAENAGLTTIEPEKMFHEMMVAIGDSLSDIASSNLGEDWEVGDDEESEKGQLSEYGKPGWVMGTITKTVQQRMERFQQKQMKLEELKQPGWEEAADYFSERDTKYCTSTLRVPAVMQLQTDDDVSSPAPKTFGVFMVCLYIVPGISQLLQWTTRSGSSHLRLGSGTPLWNISIPSLAPSAEPDLSTFLIAMPIEPGSLHPCI